MDPDSKLSVQLSILNGGANMEPTDIVNELPRHASKKYRTRSESKIDMVVVHCTDRDWTVQQLAEYDTAGSLTYERKVDGKLITDINHINSAGIPGITYHDCIEESAIYHTLPYVESSYHAGGYNSRSVAIAMLYRTTNPKTSRSEYKPPDGMVKLTQCHAAELCLRFGLAPDRVFGHRELRGTGWDWIRGRKRLLKSCPGIKVNMITMRYNIAMYMQIKLKMSGVYDGKLDGDFGKRSKAALNKYKGK